MRVDFELNGSAMRCEVGATDPLLEVLRGLGLTGTKEGCGVGVCGLCTVRVGDRPVSSCLYLAPCVEGKKVWTVEGVAESEPALVDAFVEHEGMQCGICTPGQVVTASSLAAMGYSGLNENELRSLLAGNLCRCTGYTSIVASVRSYLER